MHALIYKVLLVSAALSLAVAVWYFWSRELYPEWSASKARTEADIAYLEQNIFLYSTGSFACAPKFEERHKKLAAGLEERFIPGSCGCVTADLDLKAAKVRFARIFNSRLLSRLATN